jgi:hypothetical protein
MAYYYIAGNWDIYKTVGTRYVKRIYKHNRENLFKILKNREGAPSLPKITIPTIRRVFPQLIANKITSVQPMTMDIGRIFMSCYSNSGRKQKHRRHAPGFKRKRRNRHGAPKRNNIRIEKFRAQIETRFESNDFEMVMFELAMKNL